MGTIAEQWCNGCGIQFTGMVTEETRNTKHVFPGKPLGRLCPRCLGLKDGNLAATSDEVREVQPEAFAETVEPILDRAQALCVKIVDATDFDATCIATTLRMVLRNSPVILAVNKKDLMPRLDAHDLRFLRHRLEQRGLRCISAHAVSAITGEGVGTLAAAVSAHATGRNVIVCGGASVGKSTLINLLAKDIEELSRLREVDAKRQAPLTPFQVARARDAAEERARAVPDGTAPRAARTGGFSFDLREVREDAVGRLRLTESHMPGTTLAAISIPCLGSWAHAMFDTPGVVLRHSVAYSLFPVHLMAPLMLPKPLTPRLAMAVKPGESVLLEAAWMDDTEDAAGAAGAVGTAGAAGENAPMVLGRIDVVDVEGGGPIFARQLASTAVRARVVPTASAPCASVMPSAFLEHTRQSFLAEGNTQDAKALGDGPISRPLDAAAHGSGLKAHYNHATGARGLDVSFANLGWITLYSSGGADFSVDALPVDGSQAWARPPLYEFGAAAASGEAIVESAAHERAYDVAAIEKALAVADAEWAAEEAERAKMRVTAAEELGSSRRCEVAGAADGVFGDEDRRRLREELFGNRKG